MDRLVDYSHIWIPLIVLAVAAAIWELAVVSLDIPPFILPSPIQVMAVLVDSASMLTQHTLYTLQACILGFALALIAGVAFAVLVVQSPLIEQTTYTLLVSMNSVPKVAIAPLFIVWLGTGLQPKVALGIDVDEVYLHCAKAFRRAGLWDPGSWPDAAGRPSPGEIWKGHLHLEAPARAIEADLEAGYTATMWQPGGDDVPAAAPSD